MSYMLKLSRPAGTRPFFYFPFPAALLFISMIFSGCATAQIKDSPAAPCNMMLSFYSIGEGIDNKAVKDLGIYLEQYKNSKVLIDTIWWGREGEIDFCLKFKNLSPEKKGDLINGIRKTLEKAEHVTIEENKDSSHRRP